MVTADNGEPPTPDKASAVPDLYRIAIEEYRFQVGLNWDRTQHWFALNAAIAGAAVALLHIATKGTYLLVAGVFFFGAVACGVGAYAIAKQHQYYRSIRDHVKRIERDFGFSEYGISTTGGMGSKHVRRWPTLTHLYIALILFLAVVDLGGFAYGAYRFREDSQETSKQTHPFHTNGRFRVRPLYGFPQRPHRR